MAEPLRLAGTGRLSTGETITWSIADGARGRRWREQLTQGGRMVRSLLVEIRPDGQLGRLEIASSVGLLTAHPAADASSLHGNVVTAAGVGHLTFAWSATHVLWLDRSPAMATIVVRDGGSLTVGSSGQLDGVRIGQDLRPVAASILVTRAAISSWLIGVDPRGAGDQAAFLGPEAVDLDGRGLPILLESREWPLEI